MKKINFLVELMELSTPSTFIDVVKHSFKSLLVDELCSGRELVLGDCSDLDLFSLNQWAQRVLLLVNHCGSDVIKNNLFQMSPSDRDSYVQIKNPYDRFLWMYRYQVESFNEASETLSDVVLNDDRSTLPCTMFSVPQSVSSLNRNDVIKEFRHGLEPLIIDPSEEVSIDCDTFSWGNGARNTDVYEISVTYKKLVESISIVQKENTIFKNLMKEDKLYLMYYEGSGVIEVYTKCSITREKCAQIFAKTVLHVRTPIKRHLYSFQHLEKPQTLKFVGYPYESTATVSSLSFLNHGVRSTYELENNRSGNIYSELSTTVGSSAILAKARIDIGVNKENFPRQTTSIEFLSADEAYICASSHSDRWRWHQLLIQWDLLAEEGARCSI